MAKKWSEVIQSPAFQALPDNEKEEARNQYFDTVVAPQLPDQNEVSAARVQFDQMYGSKAAPKAVRSSPQDVQARMNAGDTAAADEFKARYKATTGEDYAPQSGAETADGSMGGANFKAAMGSTLGDTSNGLMQNAIEGGPMGNIVRAGFSAAGLQVPSNPAQEWIQKRIAEKRALDAPLMESEGGTRGAIAGNMLQLASPGAVSKVAAIKYPQAAGIAAGLAPKTYAGNAALGASMGMIQPRTEGESQAVNMGAGAAFGAGGRAIAGGLGNIVNGGSQKLSKETMALYQSAKAAGIPVHWSQLTDSKLAKTLSSIAGTLPFSGAGNAVKAQKEKFIGALGETFGLKGATNLDDDVMASAGKAISKKYDDVYGRNTIKSDAQLFVKLGQIKKKIGDDLTDDNAKVALNQINKIVNNLKSGEITGSKYQNLRGELAEIIASNKGNSLGSIVKQARKALDTTAQRSVGPDDAKILAEANRQWANFQLTKKALQQVAGAKGEVNPANMWNLAKNGSTSEMRELGKVGQFIKDPIPDSGTAGRNLAAGLATGGATFGGAGAVAPIVGGIVTGSTIGRVLNSPKFGKYMAEGLGPSASNAANKVGTLAKLTSTSSSGQATPKLQQMINRSVEIRQAAMAEPDRGPEILSNLPPQEQVAAAKEFADAYGLSVEMVLQKMQSEGTRVKKLLAR